MTMNKNLNGESTIIIQMMKSNLKVNLVSFGVNSNRIDMVPSTEFADI